MRGAEQGSGRERMLHEMAAEFPDSAMAQFSLGSFLLGDGRHQEAIGPVPGWSAWIVHSQVTLSAPSRRNSDTMCRQAATNVGAGVCP